MKIEIHVHRHLGDELVVELAKIRRSLEDIMTTLAEFEAAFQRIDAATTAIANKLRELADQIGSMTTEEEEAAKTRLLGVADALEAMAANPDNPVPTPEA